MSFQCFLPRVEASFGPGMQGGLGRETLSLLVLLSTEKKKQTKLLSLAHRVFLIWLHPTFPAPSSVFSSSRQDRPFQWLHALVQAVFSAWNAFPWPPYWYVLDDISLLFVFSARKRLTPLGPSSGSCACGIHFG